MNYNDISKTLEDIIFELYGYQNIDHQSNLYRFPYNMKAYDIVYILSDAFNRLGISKCQIASKNMEYVSFHTIDALAKFILTYLIHRAENKE